jgi:hypothetical protein
MKGFLRRTETGVLVELTDEWGFHIELVGVPAERDGVKGYALEQSAMTVPDTLKVPLIDDEART